MNVIFLTVSPFNSLSDSGIYADLMRKFRDEKHNIYIVNPIERRFKRKTSLYELDGVHFLKVRTLNILKTNNIEKGIATLLLEYQYLKAIKKYFKNIKFDLVLYSTPPIALIRVISFLKKRDRAFTYLMLKDIFPQNAVDIGMIKSSGIIYKVFRKKEIILYKISNKIGCMSPANVKYVLTHNTFLNSKDVGLCPNAIDLNTQYNPAIDKEKIKNRYGIPKDSIILIYGGSLGKPQGLDFLLTIIESNKNKGNIFFVIAGSGTEYPKIESWLQKNSISNAILLSQLPKNEYDQLVCACDIGLIFLDPRFTIPNFPSRLLSYLEYRMPILAATDNNSDIGKIAEANRFGFWALNGDLDQFNRQMKRFIDNRLLISEMGENGYKFLKENYTVDVPYTAILQHFV